MHAPGRTAPGVRRLAFIAAIDRTLRGRIESVEVRSSGNPVTGSVDAARNLCRSNWTLDVSARHTVVATAVVRGEQVTATSSFRTLAPRHQFAKARLDHGFGLRGESSVVALSASISKSAWAFPAISSASLCLARSPSRDSMRALAFASATASGLAFFLVELFRPEIAPLSRARRPSKIWL